MARRLVPKDTGRTQRSIGYYLVQSERKLVIYAGTPYSIFLELGTYKMAPRPFLRPAMYEAGKVLGGKGKATGQAGSPSGPKKVG